MPQEFFTDFLQSLLYDKNRQLFFNSVAFVALFTVFYSLYVIFFRKQGIRNGLLLVFSLFFYYKLVGIYVILLVVLALIDWLVGLGIHKAKSDRKKRALLSISLIANIAALVYYKYTRFFLELIADSLHIPVTYNWVPLVSLVGISYFVFKSLSYVIDLNREMIDEPERNFFRYLLFVSLFTNIISGPIAKARDLLPQLSVKPEFDEALMSKGFFYILSGAVKKYFIADFLAANFVNRVFASPNLFSGVDNLMAAYGGIIQIYFDFAGYTDIVIGISALLGLRIMENFNRPFVSQNVTEFWRRWHISLSSWFNEYIYLPLSYNLRGLKRFGAVIAVMITFIISGLWHGDRLTYVTWGALHGLAIAWDVLSQGGRNLIKKRLPSWLYRFVSIFLTFHFIALTALIFKAESLDKAMEMYRMIFTKMNWNLFPAWMNIYGSVLAVMLIAFMSEFTAPVIKTRMLSFYERMHWVFKAAVVFVGIVLIYQVYRADVLPFIYMEF